MEKQKIETRKQIVDHILMNHDVGTEKKSVIENIISALIDEIVKAVMEGYVVRLTDFGNFRLMHRDARVGRNPKTGQPIEIPASKTIKFTVSTVLKRMCNQ